MPGGALDLLRTSCLPRAARYSGGGGNICTHMEEVWACVLDIKPFRLPVDRRHAQAAAQPVSAPILEWY